MSRKKILEAIDHRLERLRIGQSIQSTDQWLVDREDELQSLRDHIVENIPDHGKTTIKVWRFEDAPDKYKALSEARGDEDWLAFIPDSVASDGVWLFTDTTAFGVAGVDQYKTDGGIVRIGRHA